MKTVIQAWTQDCCNVETGPGKLFWGLGDMIRSTIFLHQYCKRKGYRLVVDFQCHPIASFFLSQNTDYQDFVKDNKSNIPFVSRGNVIPFIEAATSDTVLLFACDFCREPIETDTIDFIKSILIPQESLEKIIQSYLVQLPEQYSVLHIRLGDEMMLTETLTPEIAEGIAIVKRHGTENDLLITDCALLKKHFSDIGSVQVFDLKVGHLGICKDMDIIQDTLVEFFLLAHAYKIKTFTVYPWISSFVYWVSKVYRIPLHSIYGFSMKRFLFRMFWNIQSKWHQFHLKNHLK